MSEQPPQPYSPYAVGPTEAATRPLWFVVGAVLHGARPRDRPRVILNAVRSATVEDGVITANGQRGWWSSPRTARPGCCSCSPAHAPPDCDLVDGTGQPLLKRADRRTTSPSPRAARSGAAFGQIDSSGDGAITITCRPVTDDVAQVRVGPAGGHRLARRQRAGRAGRCWLLVRRLGRSSILLVTTILWVRPQAGSTLAGPDRVRRRRCPAARPAPARAARSRSCERVAAEDHEVGRGALGEGAGQAQPLAGPPGRGTERVRGREARRRPARAPRRRSRRAAAPRRRRCRRRSRTPGVVRRHDRLAAAGVQVAHVRGVRRELGRRRRRRSPGSCRAARRSAPARSAAPTIASIRSVRQPGAVLDAVDAGRRSGPAAPPRRSSAR